MNRNSSFFTYDLSHAETLYVFNTPPTLLYSPRVDAAFRRINLSVNATSECGNHRLSIGNILLARTFDPVSRNFSFPRRDYEQTWKHNLIDRLRYLNWIKSQLYMMDI